MWASVPIIRTTTLSVATFPYYAPQSVHYGNEAEITNSLIETCPRTSSKHRVLARPNVHYLTGDTCQDASRPGCPCNPSQPPPLQMLQMPTVKTKVSCCRFMNCFWSYSTYTCHTHTLYTQSAPQLIISKCVKSNCRHVADVRSMRVSRRYSGLIYSWFEAHPINGRILQPGRFERLYNLCMTVVRHFSPLLCLLATNQHMWNFCIFL